MFTLIFFVLNKDLFFFGELRGNIGVWFVLGLWIFLIIDSGLFMVISSLEEMLFFILVEIEWKDGILF